MPDAHDLDADAIRRRTALVMPQWFPAEFDAAHAERVLRANLDGVDALVQPARVCLVVDACPAAAEAVAQLEKQRAADGLEPYVVVSNEVNLGQGGSLVRGFRALIEVGCTADWYVTRDADGDHFINDLPHLTRMADQIASAVDTPCTMVIGRRVNVRRPMTWFRGELEELVNRTLMTALTYRLARRGQVIDQRFMHPDGAWPDTQSGYKLYSADLVGRVIDAYDELGEPPWGPDTYRYVGQVALFWICIDSGGVCGEVIRASLSDEQTSSFGPETFRRQFRAKLHYVLKQSELPGPVARQILANGMLRSGVWTHPDGQALCRWLCCDLADDLDLGPDDPLLEPTFR